MVDGAHLELWMRAEIGIAYFEMGKKEVYQMNAVVRVAEVWDSGKG